MSTALYRRYRPDTFAEVIGQEHVTVPLTAALTKNRVNHAYLFSGPRGCGKTTSARILARCLNCAQGPTATPCGTCESCVELARGGPGSLDVVEIDAASHGGVDDARSLRERAAFAPARDRYKVFIIDEAHMVSTQGFNALLKIVEEPPPHVRFVFATTEPEKVIGTIRSRTHHYPFRLVPPERLQAYLAELCEAEEVPVGQGVLPLVVRAGAGSVRDSLSVLDQLMAGAGEDGLNYQLAVSLLGYTDATLLDEVIDGFATGDGRVVFGVVERVIGSGHDPRRFVEDLLERLRDLLVVAAVPDGGHGVLRGLPADQFERMTVQAARFGRAELSRAADVVNTALTEMSGATSPRLQLELLVARLLLPGAEDTERGLRARVDRLERRVGTAAPGGPVGLPATPGAPAHPAAAEIPATAAPASPPAVTPPQVSPSQTPASQASPVPASPAHGAAPVPAPVAPPSVPPVAGAADGVDAVRRMWPDVLDTLRGLRRMTWTLVSEYAQVLELDGERLVLLFDSPGRAVSFGKGSHAEYLRQSLIDVVGLDRRVEAVSGDAGQARGSEGGHARGSSAPQGRPAAGPRSPAAPAPQAAARQAPASSGSVQQPSVQQGAVQQGAVQQVGAAPVAQEPPGWGPPSGAPAQHAPGQEAPGQHAPGRAGPGRSPGGGAAGGGRPGGRPPVTRGGPAGPAGGGRWVATAPPPDDDIPLPPEPPADEPPPEDDFDPYARPGTGQPGPARPAQGSARPAQGSARPAQGSDRPAQGPASRAAAAGSPRPTGSTQQASASRPTSASQQPGPARQGGPPPQGAASSSPASPGAAPGPAAPGPAAPGPAVPGPAALGPAAPGPAAGSSSTSRYAALRAAVPVAERSPSSVSSADDEPSADDEDVEGSGLVGQSVVAQLLGGRVIEERNE